MLALIDLWFADNKTKAAYDCGLCQKNPKTAKERRCQEPGFENLKKPRHVNKNGIAYNFCPGKATWYAEIAELYGQCRVALETGILPKEGSLEEQDELFSECFPMFVTHWKECMYAKIWVDVSSFTKTVLAAVFGDKKR